jgi:quercetin dioxygenase-like cupin family protein
MSFHPFVDATEIAWENVGPGVDRKILGYDDHLMMVRVRFTAGGVGAVHTHPHRQVTFVEEGVFRVHIGSEERTLRPGDSFIISPGIPHGVVAVEEGVLVDVFTPSREDFLPRSSDDSVSRSI